MADDRADATAAQPPPRRLRVTQWFAIAAVALGIVAAISVVTAIVALGRLADERDQVVNHLDPASTAAFRMSNAFVNQETGVRGFALAGRESFLRPYRTGRVEQGDAERELRQRIAGEGLEPIAVALDAVERAARDWRTGYARPTIATVRREGVGALTRDDVRAGRRLFDTLRAALGRQRAEIRAVRRDGRERLGAAATFLYGSLAAVALLLGAALVTTAAMLRQTVTRPIAALGRRVRRVAQGEFDAPVRSDGPLDIATLAADVDSMRMTILSEVAELRAAHVQLDEQARDLERSNAELEQFAYVASHDLQEPLRKVASFCQLLEQRYAGQLDERADQYIAFAVDGAKRMQQLINDLLSFSRVGRSAAELRPVGLDGVLADAIANLASAIEESGAEVDADPLPAVRGDAALLTAVFQNLIGNAVKFRSEAPPRIRIVAAREDGEWLICCSDNGIGIDPEYAERVFVIFQRLHARSEYAGTGIGLALCRKIVEHHGGRLWLDTDGDGPGTTFRFTLPVLEEDR